MEELDINNGCGQGYGFTLYRTKVTKVKQLTFLNKVKDRAIVSNNYSIIFPVQDSLQYAY